MNNSKDKKTKECPSCAMMINAQEDVCPICGYEFPKDSPALKIAVIIFLAAIILYVINF